MGDLISVIMPAYNVDKYIGRSIESVLKQTYTNFELIVVNDGSVDDTKAVIETYQANDARIKYIGQENQGTSVARNVGMEHAGGKYISFLDADDIWAEDALEKMYQHMLHMPDCHFVYGRFQEISLSKQKRPISSAALVDGGFEAFVYKGYEFRPQMHMCGILIDREIVSRYGIRFPVGIKVSQDIAFLIEVLSVICAYGIDDVVLYYIRREDSATTSTWKPQNWQYAVIFFDRIAPFVQEFNPQIIPILKCIRNRAAYRFTLRCIRDGFLYEARESINKWEGYLRDFVSGNGKISDRMKCRAILWAKNSDTLLKLICSL